MIKKFIDGKYNLIFSYWVIYAFSATVVIIPFFFIKGPFLGLAYIIFAILYNCVVLIGTWRSSTYYIQDKKKQKQSQHKEPNDRQLQQGHGCQKDQKQ